MLERNLERLCREKVKKAGGLFYKWVSPGQNGVPDRIMILRGQVTFVELKSPKGRLTKHQEFIQQKLADAGANVTTIRTGEEMDALIAAITRRH